MPAIHVAGLGLRSGVGHQEHYGEVRVKYFSLPLLDHLILGMAGLLPIVGDKIGLLVSRWLS